MSKPTYPKWSCAECGKTYGAVPSSVDVNSWLYGQCDICKKNNYVAPPEEFGGFPSLEPSKEEN